MRLPPLSPQQSVKPPRFDLRMSVLFAAVFLPMGIHLPYFPLWLEHVGFAPGEIAVILSAPMFLRVFTMPVITALADRAGDRAHVLIALTAATFLLSLGYFLTPRAVVVLGVSLALIVAWSPQSPIGDSLAISGVRRFGSDYPRMRLWGSVSFLAANLAGGWALAAWGPAVVPALISCGLAGALLAATWTPRLGPPRRPVSPGADGLPIARRVLTDPYFLCVSLASGLVTASHGFHYAFTSIYWKGLGIDSDTVGILWAISVVAEVALFFAFRRLFGRASAPAMVLLAALAGVLRWAAMPLVWPLGLGVAGFAAAQALHAFSTGLAMLALQRMIAETVPEERMGAAQGAAGFASGGSLAAVTLAAGPLYLAWGDGGFVAMAAVSLAGGALALLAWRLSPERRLGG